MGRAVAGCRPCDDSEFFGADLCVHPDPVPGAPAIRNRPATFWRHCRNDPQKENEKIVPLFAKEILALNKKDVKIQGFMVPLEPKHKHKHFVLSAVPPSCPFCMPAGPESMVEIRLKDGIDFDLNPIVVSGRFSVRNDDPRGVFYTLTDGVPVSAAPAH